jgi:hypothetical protein
MPPAFSLVALAGALSCLSACAAASDDAETSDVRVSAQLEPDPPRVARHHLALSIADASGAPVSGASLEVRAEMPLHGHASNERVEVMELSEGEYALFPVTFTMPGRWRVVVQIAAGELEGQRTFVYEVE